MPLHVTSTGRTCGPLEFNTSIKTVFTEEKVVAKFLFAMSREQERHYSGRKAKLKNKRGHKYVFRIKQSNYAAVSAWRVDVLFYVN